jgi:hypothetical protein
MLLPERLSVNKPWQVRKSEDSAAGLHNIKLGMVDDPTDFLDLKPHVHLENTTPLTGRCLRRKCCGMLMHIPLVRHEPRILLPDRWQSGLESGKSGIQTINGFDLNPSAVYRTVMQVHPRLGLGLLVCARQAPCTISTHYR